MNRLQQQIIPLTAIIWCTSVIIDQLLGSQLGISFINEDWVSMTILTSGLFILLFTTRMLSKSNIKQKLFLLLGILSIINFIFGLYFYDRGYISSLATSTLFLLLSIHGFYFVKKEKLYLRLGLKFIVYTTSNVALIFYFLNPLQLYTFPGFESVSWSTAVGFLLYSSTLLSNYYSDLIKKSDLPGDFSILNKKFVDLWFTISFFFPVFVILVISILFFVNALSAKSGMALGLFFVCLLPFPMTYLIYLETVDWSIKMYQKNKKLFLREQDIQFHNELLQEFAQITSHNLRGPIIGLKNLTELALDENTSEERRDQSFQLLNEKLPSLTKTVDSLAEFYNMIQAGEVKYQQCKIEHFFREAITDCKKNYGLEDIELSIEFDLVSPTIEYPEVYFKNLTYNLVSNSIKYRDKDRPLLLQVTTKSVQPDSIEITFRDNGLGMDLEFFKNKIFKFGSSYHNFSQSAGVGLFIVKNQLTRLGDSIVVNSEEGVFTEFIINLNYDGKKELGYR